ncbi:MAG: electron transport complex subunit RsxC [Elusimicrobiota bacterium]
MSLPTFPHGIHPPEAKEISNSKPIRRFPFAPYLVIFLSQHTGKPARALVRAGQEVRRGDKIAEADGFVSVPHYAPATGRIKAVTQAMNFDGKMADAIILIPHPGSPQELAPSKQIDVTRLTPAQIVAGIQNMGMVGLGGAAFPTHVKLTPPKGRKIDTLIINGCECEPYLTSDHRVMLERSAEIILGARLLAKALMVKRTIIAVESNKPDAIEVLRRAAAGAEKIEVAALETKYPQGAEKMLTKALLDREIPSGGLPADIGTMVSNVATAAEIGELLPAGRGLFERVVTISGEGIERPGNYIIPIGTPLDFILDTVGFRGRAKQVLFGGPMMGKAVVFLETPTIKGLTGIVVLAKEELAEKKQIYSCIRCAACVNACPMHLNPTRLGLLARVHAFDKMKDEFHLLDCFECGCCAYVCPSNIPLVQHFRLAKGILRKRQLAAAANGAAK